MALKIYKHGSAAPIEANPLIWLVIGDKPGDNAQIEIIAEALGLPFAIKRVLPKDAYILGKPRFTPSLYHLDLERSDRLEPPWPELILTIGRRPAMAALWIQEQSGGRSKIVLLGRPKRWLERFCAGHRRVAIPGARRSKCAASGSAADAQQRNRRYPGRERLA